MTQGEAAVSVLIVSDYAPGQDRGWDLLRRTLRAMAKLEFDEPVEFLYCEDAQYRDRVPPDLTAILPGLRILFAKANSANALKNAGVRASRAEFVASVDADCVPAPGWLAAAVETLRAHPDVAVVSGRTRYAGNGRSQRILGLVDRAQIDSNRIRESTFVSNNNCAYRRSVYLEHPLHEEVSFFAGKLQGEKLRRLGHRLLFDPRMTVHHWWDGWSTQREYRRQLGYSVVAMRRVDPELRFSKLLRIGPLLIPAMVAYRTARRVFEVCRSARHLDVRWYEVPLALASAVILHLLEVPGMWNAFRNEAFDSTLFR